MGFPGERPTLPPPPERPLIAQVSGDPLDASKRLSAVGLGDAFTWCRRPSELSDGQRARFELARWLASDAPVIVIDEWLATCDRVTARAVAWATGRALRAAPRPAIFITSHDDLIDDLGPGLHVRVGWSPEPTVTARVSTLPACSVLDELEYRRGDHDDWCQLRHLHYAAGEPATVHSYHVLTHPLIDHPAAVAILSYPDLHSAARNLATDNAYSIAGSRKAAQRLNREVLKLSRIVVTPELRGVGLAHRLILAALGSVDARYVESVTAMGRFSRFLERVGFREVPQTPAPVEAELQDWAVASRVPPTVLLESDGLADWLDGQSVRVQRTGRRLVWKHYHHFVLHRRTRKRPPARIPGPDHEGWPEAFDVAARRLFDRPQYYIAGPLDPHTGVPE